MNEHGEHFNPCEWTKCTFLLEKGMNKNWQRVGDGFSSDSCEEGEIGMDKARQVLGKGFSSDSCKGRMFVRALKVVLTAATMLILVGGQAAFAEDQIIYEKGGLYAPDQALHWMYAFAEMAKIADYGCAALELPTALMQDFGFGNTYGWFKGVMSTDPCVMAKRLARPAAYILHYYNRGDSQIYIYYRVTQVDVPGFLDRCRTQIWVGNDVNNYFDSRRLPGIGCEYGL